jgi:uncharacterized protein
MNKLENLNNKINNNVEFNEIISDIKNNETVLLMYNYRQHYNTNCYEHCLYVSYYTYVLCKKLHIDYKSAARAAMLHDLFLYDWRKKNNRKGLHAFTHPQTALDNASEIFDLNEIEKDIISKHMWPITPKFPKYKESFIITLTDKYSALLETLFGFENSKTYKNMFKYCYVLLGVCVYRYFL